MDAEVGENQDNSFDRILEIVGNDGPYQKRFNFFFGYLLLVAVYTPSLNIIMALAVPEHWCYVPGREYTNYTMEDWKQMMIPKENNSQGIYTYSSCRMYNMSNKEEITECRYGWEYDQTWYKRTAVTQENWVCDKKLHVTNVFLFTKIGDFLGTFVFGQLGDLVGRKPTLFITIIILFLGRTMSVFTSKYIWIFASAALLGNLATPTVFQAPLTTAMEISKNEKRGYVQLIQALGATTSSCLMPIIFWIFKDWIPFMLITSLPCGIYLLGYKWIVESPRWLASRRKTKRCIKELKKIAKVNGTTLTDEVYMILEKNIPSEGVTYGFMSLFSNWALAKKTVLLMNLWIFVNILYFTLVMNVNNLGGNPFVNYLLQGFAELPAAILGKYFCDKMGRGWTHRYPFFAAAFCSTVMVFIVNNINLLWLSSITVTFLKFFTTFAWYAINLHTMETFPTCIRQTGIGLCVITASGISALAPYIIYLGTSVDLKYPYIILAAVAFFGAVTGIFLPETLNRPLPETLEDAKEDSKYKRVASLTNNVNNVEEIRLSKTANGN